jgi:hypothetical protein
MPVFLAPIFLVGTLLAAAPVVMHLLHQRKPKPVPFSTLRFLRAAVARTRRSRRLTHVLILSMRVLILLLLALAFAQPRLRVAAWLPRGPRSVVIILDGSASMQVRNGDRTSWVAAKEWAERLVGSLERGDRIAVAAPGTAAPNVIFPFTSNHAAALQAVQKLEAGHGAIDVLADLRGVLERLDYGQEQTGLEVHLFSDFQNSTWDRAAAEQLDDKLAEMDIALFFNIVRPAQPVNAGIESVDISPPVLSGDGVSSFRVHVQTTPDFPGENTLRLLAGDEALATRSFAAGETADAVTLSARLPDGADPVAGWLELLPDALAADNRFYFCLSRVAAVPLLLVAGEGSDGGPPRETFFLRHAIQPGGTSSIFQPEVTGWQDFLAAGLERFQAILISNPPTLSGAAAAKLENYVRQGGHVLIFPGDNMAADKRLPELAGFADVVVAEEEMSEDLQVLRLLPSQPQSPLEQKIANVLPDMLEVTVRKRLVFRSLPPSVETLFVYSDGTPFIIKEEIGRGSLAVASLTADRAWSDWPLNPLFLVAVQELIRAAASRNLQPTQTTVGGFLPVEWPLATLEQDFTLRTPQGTTRQLTAERTSVEAPLLLRGFEEPGLYELAAAGQRLPVAVNLPPDEGDLQYVSRRELGRALRRATLFTAEQWDEQRQQAAALRHGRPLWPVLLVAAFLLVLAEELVANQQSRVPSVPDGLRQALQRGEGLT